MSKKLPAFQFYPSDWRKDNGVQSLNFNDRGIWFEMLCLMHDSEQRGKLILNGKAMPDEAIARLLGLDKQAFSKTLTTLLDFGVCSRDENGVLFNRRMVKDEESRSQNAQRQREFYQKNQQVAKPNEQPNDQPNANLTEVQQKPNIPSSSSSSSSTSVKEKKRTTSVVPKEKKIGCRIPDDFEVTDDLIDWARINAPNASIALETQKFKNYYSAKTGKDATRLDWSATWRNWMLNAEQWQGNEVKNGTNQRLSEREKSANRLAESKRRSQAKFEQSQAELAEMEKLRRAG
jgi:hypothetical protein